MSVFSSSVPRSLLAVALLSTLAACAVTPADTEEPVGSADEAILITKAVSLELKATLNRVQTSASPGGTKELQFLSFHVTNVGSVNAVASQVVISCTASLPSASWTMNCLTPIVIGIPALPVGAFFDYSWPTRGVSIGGGYIPNPAGTSFSETITAQLQSTQRLTAGGSVTFTDACSGFAGCTAVATMPSPAPGGAGTLGTPAFWGGYFYSSVSPTLADFWLSDASEVPLSPGSLHGGMLAHAPIRLLTPQSNAFVGQSGQTIDLYMDGVLVASGVTSAGFYDTILAFTLPPYDANVHTLQTRFAGTSALAPTRSRTQTFTLVP